MVGGQLCKLTFSDVIYSRWKTFIIAAHDRETKAFLVSKHSNINSKDLGTRLKIIENLALRP